VTLWWLTSSISSMRTRCGGGTPRRPGPERPMLCQQQVAAAACGVEGEAAARGIGALGFVALISVSPKTVKDCPGSASRRASRRVRASTSRCSAIWARAARLGSLSRVAGPCVLCVVYRASCGGFGHADRAGDRPQAPACGLFSGPLAMSR